MVKILLYLLLFVLLLPFGTLILAWFHPSIFHIFNPLYISYIMHSVLLVLGVGALTAILGAYSAITLVLIKLPFQPLLTVACMLPLAIPPYISAMVYQDMFSQSHIWAFNITPVFITILLFSCSFYPYVFLLVKASLIQQGSALFSVSFTLGKSFQETIYKVIIPLLRPAIIAGASLAVMESLADFGTVSLLGYSSLTHGIYSLWYGQLNQHGALHLSLLLLAMVLMVLYVERVLRGKKNYDVSSAAKKAFNKHVIPKWQQYALLLPLLIPVLIGFIIPVMYLAKLSMYQLNSWADSTLWHAFFSSLFIAIIAAVIIGMVAWFLKWHATKHYVGKVIKLAISGYILPGAVIAIALLIPLTWLDKTVAGLFASNHLWITGTIGGLLLAYVIRFITIPYHGLEAGYSQFGTQIDDAAKMLGIHPFKRFTKLHLPLLSPTLLAALLLVMVEVIKELPATLILRPFGFQSLSIRAYELARDEQLMQAANPALLLILLCLIPLCVVSKPMERSHVKG